MRLYRKFTSKPFRVDFFFCMNPSEYQKRFSLSKSRSEQQIKFQARILSIITYYQLYILFFFGVSTLKMAVKNVALTSHELVGVYYLINTAKIVGYLCFYLAIQASTLGSLLCACEALVGCQFLCNSLDHLRDQMLALFSDKNRQKMQNKAYLTKRINNLSKSYGKLLARQDHLDKHFDKSLHFMVLALLFSLFYPAILIFDSNAPLSTWLIYSFNYLMLNVIFFTVVIYNSKFLNSNQNFMKSLSSLSVNAASIKLLNIHMLNQERTAFSFTYNHLFSYTSSFYLFVSTCLLDTWYH